MEDVEKPNSNPTNIALYLSHFSATFAKYIIRKKRMKKVFFLIEQYVNRYSRFFFGLYRVDRVKTEK